MSNKTDWIARIYDEKEEVVEAWYVENRTKEEARHEIAADITRLHPSKDWTLSKAEDMDGGPLEIRIDGSVFIETHTESVHDVLWHDVRYCVQQEWPRWSLRKAIEDAVIAHLAERGITDAELDVFEEYLDSGGREMVEVEIDVK